MSSRTQKRAAAFKAQVAKQGVASDSTSPFFEQRLLCQLKDTHAFRGAPDLRNAKHVAPPVPAKPQTKKKPAAGPSTAADPGAAAGPSGASSQPSDAELPPSSDSPDSPYRILSVNSMDMLELLDELMMKGFEAIYWADGIYIIPGFPKDAKKAAQLQSQVDQLIEQGDAFEAFPWQVQMAMYNWHVQGQDHPDTLRAIFAVCQATYQVSAISSHLYIWILTRAARQWGVAHPDVRVLVEQAAEFLSQAPDPREHTLLTELTAAVAKHLPGGLGWGTAAITPLPDEEIYAKHAILQFRANTAPRDKAGLKLAKDMLERCVAYYESVGPHWLASPRRFRSVMLLGQTIAQLDGPEAAEKMLGDGKRAAQRELGALHRTTLVLAREHAYCLRKTGREGAQEKAMSLFQKVLRQRKEVLGPLHHNVFEAEEEMAKIFMEVGRYDEALALAKHVFEDGYKALGQIEPTVCNALRVYYRCLKDHLGRPDEAAALRKRATALGYQAGMWQ